MNTARLGAVEEQLTAGIPVAGELGRAPGEWVIYWYPRAPPSEIPGTRFTWGCGRNAGILHLDRHRVTSAGRRDSGIPSSAISDHLKAHGKAIFRGDKKLHIRGVTYGTFRPDDDGGDFPPPEAVARGLRRHGGARRQRRPHLHGPAPLAARPRRRARPPGHGRPALGAARHLPRRPRPRARRSSERSARRCASCAGHPAVLCYAIGNEIPASIVRWHGRQPDRALPASGSTTPPRRRTRARSSPTSTTRAPSTSSCRSSTSSASTSSSSPGPQFESYLARLQNIAGDRPLLVTETGLDSRRNGEERAGARRSTGRCAPRSPPAAPGCSCSRGPTSGTAAASTSRTGTSASSTASASPSRRWPPSARRSPRRPFRADPAVAADLGRRLRLQQRDDAAGLPRRPARARLPGLRGDRRQRRLDRPHRRDRARVRLPPDQHREPRPRQRPQRRPRGRDRRDRRLHRRRRPPRPALARRTSRPPS